MIRKLVVAAILGILVTASGAMAQEEHWQEISAQGTGFFTKDSSGRESTSMPRTPVAFS